MTATTPSTKHPTPSAAATVAHGQQISTTAAVLFGMKVSILVSLPLGFFIGLDRAPGSFYTYGISCFIWPMIFAIGMGAFLGGSIGYISAAILHGGEYGPHVAETADVAPSVPATKPTQRLRLHLHHRH